MTSARWGGRGVREFSLKLRMVGDGGWGEGGMGGHPVKCGHPHEFLKMAKIHQNTLIANAQCVSLPDSIISQQYHNYHWSHGGLNGSK